MRSLPESLQSKLSQQMQTVHNDADPRMEVVVARARTEVVDYTYWTVETIRETSGLGDYPCLDALDMALNNLQNMFEAEIRQRFRVSG